MAVQPSPDIREQLLQLQRSREELRQQNEELQQRNQELERQNQQSTLLEYLDLCHLHLNNNFKVQPNAIWTTQGSADNAARKCRPKAIRHWDSFLTEQSKIWERMMKSDLFEERLFPSKPFLMGTGKSLGRKLRGSELDLHLYLETAMHDPLKNIMSAMFDNSLLRTEFNLFGTVDFENHANTLAPDGISAPFAQLGFSTEEDERQQPVQQRTRSRQKVQKQKQGGEGSSIDMQPRADQLCVYQNGDNQRRPLMVCEYKPAHKFSLNFINVGLEGSNVDIDVDDIVRVAKTKEPLTRQMRRLVAAVITQAFSYMITAGLEFGCVCTGEATIFLQVREDQPETVYYYLSVPREEIGEITGWVPDVTTAYQEDTRLHLTAVGQMIAFILRARESRVRKARWRREAKSKLKIWSLQLEEILSVLREKLESPEKATSECHPSPIYNRIKDLGSTPIRRVQPSRRARTSSRILSNSARGLGREGGDDEDEGDDEATSYKPLLSPSPLRRRQPNARRGRAQSSQGSSSKTGQQKKDSMEHDRTAQYCSQDCILGLRNRSELDPRCPNLRFHGGGTHHTIDSETLLTLLREQFAEDPDLGCKAIGRPGARGVLFRLQLVSLGYVIAAKGSPIWFLDHLKYESAVYNRLQSIQGRHVPVQLGILSLHDPFLFEGIAEISHMLCLSFSGTSLASQKPDDDSLLEKVRYSLQAVHSQAILQSDAEVRNLLWQDGRVMVIDFERAQILEEERIPLGSLPPNRQRTRGTKDKGRKNVTDDRFARELAHALANVRKPQA